jgi:hypothetical protein
MKRKMIGALVGALCCSATLSIDVAHAAPKKKAKAAAAQQEAPESAGISDAMGDLHWGMTRDEVLGSFVEGIKAKYKPLIAKASGAIEEDKLRNKAREELGKIKSSIVDFNGKKTGWDVSFLKGEFTHNNNESMFVVTDDASQNYYFFINNKLWKWYKAFNSQAFQGKSFDQFAGAIQGRYGKAQEKQGEGKQKYLAWQDKASSLRAVDNNQFYGFYCLVFESKTALAQLSDLRPNKGNDGNKAHALVDSATSDAAEESDNNPDIIDRITGKMRVRQNAPESSAQATTTSNSGKKAPAASEAPVSSGVSGGGVSADDDPLKGLGI